MELLEVSDGYARMSMKIGSYHANSGGVVHGGAIASLADQVAMRAVQSNLPDDQFGMTIQMDMHYLAVARGGVLFAEGRIRKMGNMIAFVDADVKDEKGKTVAMARCTIVIMTENAKGGK